MEKRSAMWKHKLILLVAVLLLFVAGCLEAFVTGVGTGVVLYTFFDERAEQALENLGKTNWKDPAVLSGYGLALIAGLIAAYQKKKRMGGK